MSNLFNFKDVCIVGLAVTVSIATTACKSNSTQQQAPRKKLALELMSDRECIPPAYRTAQDARRATKPAGMPPAPAFDQPPIPQPEPADGFAPVAEGGPVFVAAEGPAVQPVLPPDAGLSEPVRPLPPPPPAEGEVKLPKPPVAKRTYTVQKNDYLSVIAYRYDVNVDDLARENNITDPNRLRVGQVLTLPEDAQETPRPRPVIKRQKPAVAATSQANSTSGNVYVVQKGDSFSKIAKKLNISEEDLKTWNPNVKDTNRIYAGQKLNYGTAPEATKKPAAPTPANPGKADEPSKKLPKATIQPAVRMTPSIAQPKPAVKSEPIPLPPPSADQTGAPSVPPQLAPAPASAPAPENSPVPSAEPAPAPAASAPVGPTIPDVPAQTTTPLQPGQQPAMPPLPPMPSTNY